MRRFSTTRSFGYRPRDSITSLIEFGTPRPPAKRLSALCEASHKRQNYLFAGSDAGGDRAAAFYTLIGSAKLNGLDPQAYLRHVLERISEHPINRINELLPWNVDLAPLETLRHAA